jgi:hypothetical protein
VTRENIDPNEHVLCAAMSLPLPSPTDNEREKDETFVDSYREIEEKLEMVLSRLSKLEEKSQSEKRAQSLLVAENNKMAAEITCLTTTVNELREENESIRTLLDNKQNEWIQVESRIPNKPTTKTVTLVKTDNRYAALAVEDPITESSLPVENINENNNDPEPTTSHKTRQHRDVRKASKEKKQNPQPLNQQGIEKTLVIGDSMVKNISEKKIERAARGKSICHSYSGATVPQLHQKFQQNCDEEKYKTIILHIGTNDLVREDADNVAKKMDVLIEEVKSRAERVAVSSVIERHDGRVPASKITSYNNLVYNLCTKHNINYINNDDIDKSLLNGSNLHLNKAGDKALGGAFCSYLKSSRPINTRQVPSRSNQHFFHQTARHTTQWTEYLMFVSQVLRN